MFTDNELAILAGMGYEINDGIINGMPSLQSIIAHRNATQTDWQRSLLLFIGRNHVRVCTHTAIANYLAFDIQLVRPLKGIEGDTREYPGMTAFSVSGELATLLGKPYHRDKNLLVLDCEPDTLVEELKRYIEQPNLRLPYNVAY